MGKKNKTKADSGDREGNGKDNVDKREKLKVK
jgi:hypothetical protein